MLLPKQTRYLKKLAHDLNPIIQIGKDGLSDNLLETIDQALKAHELIKISVLQNNSDITAYNRCEFVFKIGRQLIFYRTSKNRKIILP